MKANREPKTTAPVPKTTDVSRLRVGSISNFSETRNDFIKLQKYKMKYKVNFQCDNKYNIRQDKRQCLVQDANHLLFMQKIVRTCTA